MQIELHRNIPFAALEAVQQDRTERVLADPSLAYLLVSEPEPTYTGGVSADPTGLIWSPEKQAANGISQFRVDRGGQWTYHGPGQIVVYPILKLSSFGYGTRGVRRFLADFRQSIQDWISSAGFSTEAGENPFGIYRDQKKLASFGIGVRRGVTRHGVAVYLDDQRAPFQGINPCGVVAQPMTSLNALGLRLPWEDAAPALAAAIKKSFKNSQKSLISYDISAFQPQVLHLGGSTS